MNEVQAELARFHRDTQYYEGHYAELLERYPEQWVAIYHERVVGAAPDFDELLDDLQTKEIPVGHVFVEHLTLKEDLLILPS